MVREKITEDGKTYIKIPYYRENSKTTVFPEYEMNVLENIRIQGMSTAIRRNVKREVYFLFPVISCITMKEKFQREYLDKDAFCVFFEELLQVYENMEIYLIDKKLICLEPEYIFFDETEGKYVFLPVGSESKNVLDNYEKLFTFFADICSVEEKGLLEFIFESFTSLNRSSFNEEDFLKNIVKYRYRKEKEEEIREDSHVEEFEDEEECEIEETSKSKGILVIGILLLFLAFWLSYMCKEEFRYSVAGIAACLLSICLLGYEVVKKVMEVVKGKPA